jgi:class 3 adenylate cyclase
VINGKGLGSLTYTPKPLDTSGIDLPGDILELSERLARNTHENWASQRLRDGWAYGPERNDARKEHPCLVPYEELTESEKQYDRNTALETLKVILLLGYRLARHDEGEGVDADAPSGREGDATDRLQQSLQNLEELDLASVFAVWQSHDPEQWSGAPATYLNLGQRMLRSGEPLIAYDILSEGMKFWPTDVRLRQQQALALARSGVTRKANLILSQLYDEGSRDEETVGLLARTHKDQWARATDPAEKERQLSLSYKFYREAYELSGGYWTGINAATTALLLGRKRQAADLAREVRALCLLDLKAIEERGGDQYWALATLGEAALITNDWGDAESWYMRAAEAGRGRFGELNSTRRNARLITETLGRDRKWIDSYLKIPTVVVFAGHMIDRPGRKPPRFPPELEDAVRVALRHKLKNLNVGLGYASAACGSDIIFLETLLELGGEAHVVLPYNQSQFVEDSVEITPGTMWRERFESVLERASEVLVASEQRMEGGVPFEYANLLLHGLASIRGEQLETEMIPLAVWDRKPGDGAGGTASIVEHWQSVGHAVEIIDLAELLEQHYPNFVAAATPAPDRQARAPETDAELPAEMIAILFADAVNFSKLSEDEIPRFVRSFLGTIGELANNSNYPPIMKNTWGDGLYFVFKSVKDAGKFALELSERLGAIDWTEKGLPKEMSLRIALHAGPVYSCVDPVTGQPNYIGTHVSRAARIEPITPPGQVYASQAFAALSAAQHVKEFTCEYVGRTPLAKGYGTFPTYHVRNGHH